MPSHVGSCTLVGHIVKDAETFANGKIGKFTLACNTNYKKDGEWVNDPNFFDCQVFGKLVDIATDRCTKGAPVLVEVSPRQNTWTTDDGSKRSKIVFNVNRIVTLEKKEKPDASFEPEEYTKKEEGDGW